LILHLLRHGRTTYDRHLIGRTNADLTPAGWIQMREQIDRLAWTQIVTSPLKRAQGPALEAADGGGAVCRIDADWREMNFGDWDGMALDDIRAQHGEAYMLFYRDPDAHPPPNGEAWSALTARVGRALRSAIARPELAPALVVTHAGAIRASLAVACGLPRDALWTLRVAHGAVVTVDVNMTDGALWGEIVELRQP